jgi:hypothetical protein
MIRLLNRTILTGFLPFIFLTVVAQPAANVRVDTVWKVKQTNDFEIDGRGSMDAWQKTKWLTLPVRNHSGVVKETKLKCLYSPTGIYFLFYCEDTRLTSSMNKDFMELWKEDVAEVFLWTDESQPVYFEYEISPLNYELVLLISNVNGELLSWKTFYYEPQRKVKHATSVEGGARESNAKVKSWTAEFFIPYKLLRPLNNSIPQPGTKWRANFYRVDHDGGERASWSWQPVRTNFHDYERFGVLVFE